MAAAARSKLTASNGKPHLVVFLHSLYYLTFGRLQFQEKVKKETFCLASFVCFFFLNNITDDKLLSVMVVLDAYLFKLLSNEFILGSLYIAWYF